MMPKFVLAWITSRLEDSQTLQTGGHVVFVRHPERGWEIPGGHLNSGESPEQALIREVLEETGLDVEIITWNKEYYPNCLLYTSPSPRDKRQSRMPSSA